MSKMIALKGSLTTIGGCVLDGDDDSMLDEGQTIARYMGLASCPKCGKTGRFSALQ